MIYFVRSGPDGPVKIGKANDVTKRIATLQTSHFTKLIVIRTLDAPSWVEGWLHGYFAALRLHGEWFKFESDMLAVEPPEEKPRKFFPYRTDYPQHKALQFTAEQWEQVRTFRFSQEISTEAEAVRRLIDLGLAAAKGGRETLPPSASAA